MLNSMTAYASRTGAFGAFSWVWELRGVNGKGLDLRLRLPDWIEGLEPALRGALTKALTRGNVQASLKVTRSETEAAQSIDDAAVTAVLLDLKAIEALAARASVPLAPTKAADILAMRAVSDARGPNDGGPELARAVIADIDGLVSDFAEMRSSEGAALAEIVTGQLAGIATLVSQAKALLPDRAEAQATAFRAALARVLAEIDIDEGKLAQELAQLAIKSDVMEEIDRLEAHVAAAREMIEYQGPVGRKLDFLMQEFNREANTMCAKSGDAELTRIGLELKVAIDQMREQIQNVE